MPDRPWKRSERVLADILRPLFPDAQRNPLSGRVAATGTKADLKGTGDLFIEHKKWKRVPGIKVFDEAREKARKEGKRLTVVVFQPYRRPTRMALIDLDEWTRYAQEMEGTMVEEVKER